MRNYVDGFCRYLVGKKSDNTIMSYKSDVMQFLKYLQKSSISEISHVKKTTVLTYLLYLQKTGKANSTVSRTLASLRFPSTKIPRLRSFRALFQNRRSAPVRRRAFPSRRFPAEPNETRIRRRRSSTRGVRPLASRDPKRARRRRSQRSASFGRRLAAPKARSSSSFRSTFALTRRPAVSRRPS